MEYKEGKIIYFTAYGMFYRGHIEKRSEEELRDKNILASLKWDMAIDLRGNDICVMGGTSYITKDNEMKVFETVEELAEYEQKRINDTIASYRKEMQEVANILRFPLEHILCGEDTDYEAVAAYKERVKEVFGVTLYAKEVFDVTL